MKIIVFGATGLVGKHIINQLLNKGAEVAVYTRQDTYANKSVQVFTGALDEEDKIEEAIKDADVIVSAVGNRDYADTAQVVAPFVKAISKFIKPAQRFIVIAGSGLTLFKFNMLRRDLPGQPEFLKNQRADHWDAYCYLAPLDLDYLIICPTMMVEGDADGEYLAEGPYFPKSEAKQVSAGNVAHFVAAEVMSPMFKQTRIGLVNRS